MGPAWVLNTIAPRNSVQYFSFMSSFFAILPRVYVAQTLHDHIAATEVGAPERKVVVQPRVRCGGWAERGQKKTGEKQRKSWHRKKKCAKIKNSKKMKGGTTWRGQKRKTKRRKRKQKRHKGKTPRSFSIITEKNAPFRSLMQHTTNCCAWFGDRSLL